MFRKLFSFAVVIAIALFVTSTAFARHSNGRHRLHSVRVASSVTPTVVAGNPADCTTGTAQHPGLGITGATTLIYGSSKSGTGTAPGVTITVVTADGITFDFSASLPAGEKILAVLAKGGSQGGNLYDYRPGGVLSDSGLHPPPTGNGSQFAGISHLLFCYGTPTTQGSGAGSGNGPGPVPGGTTNGGTTNNTSGTPTPGVTVTAPSTQGTPPNGTQYKAPSKQKVKAKKVKKVKHSASRRPLRRAGFTG